MALSLKHQVFSAADLISFECTPTVAMVQAATGVSKADAARYLEEWAEEQPALRGRGAETPESSLEYVTSQAGAYGPTVPTVMNEQRHANADISGPPKRNRELPTAEPSARIAELESTVAFLEEQLGQARTAERNSIERTVEATSKLAAAEARADTLQRTYDSLLKLVVPERQSH